MEVNFKYYSEALHYFSKDAVLGFSVNGGIRLLYFFAAGIFLLYLFTVVKTGAS